MDSGTLKYTLKTFLVILILSFIVDKLVFYTFNVISDKVFTGQSIGKLNHYLQVKDGLDFMIMGSSRANHNIDPAKITGKGFNMGKDGAKLAYSATLIKTLSNSNPQTILLHIDPENAFSEDYKGEDIQALLSKYNRNTTMKNEIDALDQDNILQNYFWSLSYNGKALGILKNALKPNYNYKTYTGYDPIYVSENQQKIFKEIIKREKDEVDCHDQYVINEVYADCLDQLDAFCKAKNKTLILFTSPKFDDDCSTDNKQFGELLKTKHLIYYDLTHFFKDNNDLEYWKDKTHLSHKGAELFTEKIRTLIPSK